MSVAVAATATALAVLLWPSRRPPDVRRRGVERRRERRGAVCATVDEAAVALTLLAAVLRGGHGAVESLEAVAAVDPGPAGRELAVVAAAHRWGVPADRVWDHVGPGWAAAATAWHAAAAAGAAPAGLVEDAARRIRVAEGLRLEAAAHRAGTMLVLPLGLCFLPGFVATTVVPVVLLLVGDGLG